ncbi:gamma-glutamylcyclotransferase [Roseomonas alkaliterrae]|uniref:Putative gamma-glutamylcyclotransferase n=1 Tax=Neoroseomonas alkaliterrae TaxID=1452450 RepID=A0A840Y3L4_9PROT|nr:gamma-glutamylcyclotransferase (GGCT)/AIG2-like uncharacterized protein YtfP [Neoroseomonas alkaliterrae]MBR0676802.1 gamma-glutamylcyclotransferase [Neoroseomonas alkaliterrae]
MILFLYGTLLDPGVLARMAGEQTLARRMRPARLAGWRRVFLRGTPYPTLLRDPASAVEGAVLRAGEAARARLAAYEGSAYALVPVTVATARGAVRARAWIAAPWRADPARPWPVAERCPPLGWRHAARLTPGCARPRPR